MWTGGCRRQGSLPVEVVLLAVPPAAAPAHLGEGGAGVAAPPGPRLHHSTTSRFSWGGAASIEHGINSRKVLYSDQHIQK